MSVFRFFKHTKTKAKQENPELLSKEPEEIKPPEILVEDVNESDESVKMKSNIPLGTYLVLKIITAVPVYDIPCLMNCFMQIKSLLLQAVVVLKFQEMT